ncbi:MAG: putative ATP-binding protein involved in virulence [Saprospiraceae bacterium]|jgi:predicted ATP-binding protein involved in virulence
MEDNFIKSISIKKVRHLKALEIKISEDKPKHLILTGMNGSGKTSLLNVIQLYLPHYNEKETNGFSVYNIANDIKTFEKEKVNLSNSLGAFVDFHSSKFDFISFHYATNRRLTVSKSEGVKDTISSEVKDFEKFLAKKRTEQAFLSFEKGNSKQVKAITDWFDHLEKNLKYLFEDETVELKSKRTEDKIDFYLSSAKRENFDFNNLSDGYSSILYILFEIIMKMDNDVSMEYNKNGIALIDEIEAHLHVSLQKKILPFLTSFFPNIQFIVSTHSPFVLQSEPNSVIFDLETKERFEDFSHYSSEAILETYLNQDKFSNILKEEMKEYEALISGDKKIVKNKKLILNSRNKLSKIPDIEVSYWLKNTELKHSKTIKKILQ